MVSVKANCIDSTAAPEAVFAREVQKLKEERIKPFEQLTLEPFERGKYHFSGLGTELTLGDRSLHCNWQICALFELGKTRIFKWKDQSACLSGVGAWQPQDSCHHCNDVK